jgi:hypothetical protein
MRRLGTPADIGKVAAHRRPAAAMPVSVQCLHRFGQAVQDSDGSSRRRVGSAIGGWSTGQGGWRTQYSTAAASRLHLQGRRAASRLHPLKGRLAGFYAVTVSGNWWVIFRFEEGVAVDVDYGDDH